jgi:hypothetical protein
MPLYRRLEKNIQLVEFRCTEYLDELFWGELNSREVTPQFIDPTLR